MFSRLRESFQRSAGDGWGDTPKPHWYDASTLDPKPTIREVLQASELVSKYPMFFGDIAERGDYDALIRWVRTGKAY